MPGCGGFAAELPDSARRPVTVPPAKSSPSRSTRERSRVRGLPAVYPWITWEQPWPEQERRIQRPNRCEDNLQEGGIRIRSCALWRTGQPILRRERMTPRQANSEEGHNQRYG